MKRQLVILIAAIGALPLLAASFQRLQPTQQLTVYDADGKKVGIVSGGDDAYSEFLPLVSFKVDSVPFMLFVFREGFVAAEAVLWESPNCSGVPYIPSGIVGYPTERSSLPLVAVGIPGSTVYVENGAPQSVTVRSYSTIPLGAPRDRPALPTRCESQITPWTRVVVPARALIDMNTLYKPPFSVR